MPDPARVPASPDGHFAPMHLAFIASEAVPFAKTGGLADVIGALPCALERLGHKVSVVLPFYREARNAGQPIQETGWTLRVPVGAQVVEGHVGRSGLPGSEVAVYLIDQPGYFDRDQLYQGPDGRDFPDSAERFASFARAALETVRRLEVRAEVLHCHDWQTGLVPVDLEEFYRPHLGPIGTLLTVHNLAYQGAFEASTLARAGINRRQIESHGRVNYLRAGLFAADMISTVSPTYAREIQTPEYGCGLDGLLRSRRDDLKGIVNGIDTALWSPSREPMLAARYDLTNYATGKAACKAALQRRLSLPERPDVPLFAQVGRLDPQKGWDLLLGVADDLLSGEVQLVVLGEGQPRYHERLDWLADRHPGKLRVVLDFSNVLAHQIEAGADVFLMPSLYEPCGLNQLYSQAHGTVPVVRATGGLADTVVDATPERLADGTATGIVFRDPTPQALRGAIARALSLWKDRAAWNRLVENGMRADWSWDRSAREYVTLYDQVRRRAAARAGRVAGLARAV
jgi:starch synthase